MEDEESFIPDYDEDFVVIDEAGDDVPEEDESMRSIWMIS